MRVLSLLAAGKPSESLFDGLDISRCNSKARYGYGGDADAESERNSLRLFYFPWRLVSGFQILESSEGRETGLGTRNMGTLPGAYRSPPPSSPGSALKPWSSTSPRPSPAGNAGMPGQWYGEPRHHRAQG